MKKLAILLVVTFSLSLCSSPIKGNIGARWMSTDSGETPLYDAEVEWIGWHGISAGDAKNTNIIIEDVPWDSFSVSLYVPSTSLLGYRAAPGGLYSYHACNRIGFNGGKL